MTVHNPKTSMPSTSADVDFSRDGVTMTVDIMRGTTIISAIGELDAYNVHHLVGYVSRRILDSRTLVINLTGLGFLGAQGIQALFDIDDACHRAGVQWALLAGRPVHRLLQICDQDGMLPTVPSIQHALQHFALPPDRRLLQLVPQSS